MRSVCLILLILIKFVLQTACVSISNLVSNEIGPTFIELKWTVDEIPYQYKLTVSHPGGNVEVVRPDSSATSYTINGLKPGTAYFIELRVYSMLGPGNVLNVECKTCGDASDSITNVNVAEITANSMTVTWTGPSTNYNVIVWTPNGKPSKKIAAAGIFTITFTDLTDTKAYYVSIEPTIFQNSCGAAKVVVGLIYLHAEPRVPTVDLQVVPLGPESIAVTWTLLTNQADPFYFGYNLRVVKAGEIVRMAFFKDADMSTVIGGLTPDTSYDCIMETAGIYSRNSVRKNVSTPPGAPSAPTDLKASFQDDKLTVTWAAVPSATKYAAGLYQGSILVHGEVVKITTFSPPKVSMDIYYEVKVAAYVSPVNGLGGGYGPVASKEDIIATPPTFPTPPIPVISSASAIGSNAASVKWGAVPDAYGYKVNFTAPGKPAQVFVYPATITLGVFAGLADNTNYDVEVSTVCIDVIGQPSQSKKFFLPKGPPLPPTNVKLVKNPDCHVEATWNAPVLGAPDGYSVTVYLLGQLQTPVQVAANVLSVAVTVADNVPALVEVKAFNEATDGLGGGYSEGAYSQQVVFEPNSCPAQRIDGIPDHPLQRVARSLHEVPNQAGAARTRGEVFDLGTAVGVTVGVVVCTALVSMATIAILRMRPVNVSPTGELEMA